MTHKNKSIERVMVCVNPRCKYERHEAVAPAKLAVPPRPCPRCGGMQWTQKV